MARFENDIFKHKKILGVLLPYIISAICLQFNGVMLSMNKHIVARLEVNPTKTFQKM